MKLCRTCGVEKPIEDFYQRRDRPNGVMSKCKDCVKVKYVEWRELNPDKYRAGVKMRNRNARERAIAQLGGQCARCGQLDYKVLEIDHTNGLLDRPRLSGSALISQVDKYPDELQVLCSNCHTIKTLYPEAY